MRRRTAEIALALAFLAGSANADAPMTAKQLSVLMERLAKVPERRATFREEKILAALERPISTAGRLVYRRPDHLEKHTTEPVAESFIVEGERLTVTMGEEAPRIVDLAATPELRALVDTVRGTLAGDLEALQRYYAITAESTGRSWRLTLTPATPVVARFVRQVIVNGTAADATFIQILQANGDEQRMFIKPAP